MSSRLYTRIPKGLNDNLAWRRHVLVKAEQDKELQADLRAMCIADPLFFINGFCWIFEPRRAIKLPFITYQFQDDLIDEIDGAMSKIQAGEIANQDFIIVKSRDQGATWCVCVIYFRRWALLPLQSILLGSRKEELVDGDRSDSDTLFWKLDFLRDHLPWWLVPKFKRNASVMANLDMDSVINGTATTGDMGRGGRRISICPDEFAHYKASDQTEILSAITSTTNCRIFLSTPRGADNEFYRMANPLTPGTGPKRIDLHWSNHPVQRRGLYRGHLDRVEYLDESYDWTAKPDYQFLRDGKLRSPWYDDYCNRLAVQSLIAQELDLSFVGSGNPFFQPDEVLKAEKEMACEPMHVGELLYDRDLGEPRGWHESEGGCMRLWCEVDDEFAPVFEGSCVISADVSNGTGASNTCFTVANRETKKKIAEYVNPRILPEEAAVLFAALGRWFANKDGTEAYAIWEANGPGNALGERLVRSDGMGYKNVYLRRDDKTLGRKIKDMAGWPPTREGKQTLLGNYGMALAKGQFINPSREAIREMGEYKFVAGGGIEHFRAVSDDPSGARSQHGDRVIADALACKALAEVPRLKAAEKKVPWGSLAWRMQQDEQSQTEGRYAGIW